MSDLGEMIDETTKRLLRKIDNWTIPKSDKEYVTIEKEVWESTLRQSMEMTAKAERLQKQLDIAVKALEDYAESDNWELENEKYIYWAKKGQPYPWRLGRKALKEIKELNNANSY